MMTREDWFSQCSAKEQEALYRAELENYSEKLVVNSEGRIVFINSRYAEEFGKKPEDVIGTMAEDFFTEHGRPPIFELNDFASPYIPYVDRINMADYHPVFIRSPLTDAEGVCRGFMFYDGQEWLKRYQNLYDKLNTLESEHQYLHLSKSTPENRHFIGDSPAIQQLKLEILHAAQNNATLLIEGETGVGKEVVANEVCRASARRDKPYIKLNCAALPQELIESELFGYEEGAFTGARRGGKAGLFEQANGGTILLDEINSLNLPAQAKLLRVLQERVVTRVGGNKTLPLDIRVIAISNRSLEEMVEENSFRGDLYYRLNVLHINVPPLRERSSDIPSLVHFFVRQCNEEMGKHVDKVDPQVYALLKGQYWPGNVRQLQNWVERAMATVWKNTLLPSNFYWTQRRQGSVPDDGELNLSAVEGGSLAQMMERLESEIIKTTLRQCEGNKTKAAQLLGISRQMLHRKIRQFHLA